MHVHSARCSRELKIEGKNCTKIKPTYAFPENQGEDISSRFYLINGLTVHHITVDVHTLKCIRMF